MAEPPLVIDIRAPHCMASLSGARPGSAHETRVPAVVIVAVRCNAGSHIFQCALCDRCYQQMRPDWHRAGHRLCSVCGALGVETRGGVLLEAIALGVGGRH